MFKKIVVLIVACHVSIHMTAQFFRGVGLFVGGTTSSHKYVNKRTQDDSLFTHTIPAPSHRSAEYISWSAGIFGEFLRYDHFRWQTEFEYCHKGAVEHPLLFPWPPIRGGATANTFTNIQWNNFAKFFFNEGYRGTPYIMIGARLEYNIKRKVTAYNLVVDKVPKLTVTPDVALGYEFVSFSKFKLFTEVHFNPDAIKLHVDELDFWNRTWELRVGVIYRPQKGKHIDDCNAPKYHGTNY